MIYPLPLPPGMNLGPELAAAGVNSAVLWLAGAGAVELPGVDADSPEGIAAVAILAAHVPADPPALPPSLEERVADLEAWRATMEGG